ncbi:thioesterase-like superfamily-domain-containing protein [Hypoxylon sp. FL1150]|nr:thioesterase-like superfamily-domain-containing protein [Hypoxylon sp. FL1150]
MSSTMAQGTPVESLVAVIEATKLGPDIYINKGNLTYSEGIRSAFGGSQLGQSAAAAAATVPSTFQIYSMQCVFLRSTKPNEKVHYRVERTLDGRVFASRIVRATQGSNNACLYTATICFQRNDLPAGNILDYHVPIPEEAKVSPETISAGKIQEMSAAIMDETVPFIRLSTKKLFDWRPFDYPRVEEPTKFWQRSFVRSPAIASSSPHVHQSALAYLSDMFTLGVSLHANPGKSGKRLCNVSMAITLATSLSIHEPLAKVDEWMFLQNETSWGSGGRVVIRQWYWDVKSGRLIMSGTQECLVRLKDVSKL